MEEADALADKIIIMADGEVKCSGNPLELKTKYGAGYSLSILFNPKQQNQFDDLISNYLQYYAVASSDVGNLILTIPQGENSLKNATPLLTILEDNLQTEGKEGIIRDYSISLTCLI